MELDQSVPSSFNILMLTSSKGKSGLEINVFSVKDETSSVVVVYVQQKLWLNKLKSWCLFNVRVSFSSCSLNSYLSFR